LRAVPQRAAPEQHPLPALHLLVGLVPPRLPDSSVHWSRRSLYLYNNPLGCVHGVPEHVVIDNGPRCPSNCTTSTFYDASTDACLPCGAGTFVVGVGAVVCSRVVTASMVTLPFLRS